MPDELKDFNTEESEAMLAEAIPTSHKFEIDDLVMRYVERQSRRKHEKVWTGPWKTCRILGERTVQLDSNAVVNVNDLKIRKEGKKIGNFQLNPKYIEEAFIHWKVTNLNIEDVFNEQRDAWQYNWKHKFILVTKRDVNLIDILLKCVKEPCVLIVHVPDLFNDEMRIVGTLEADWIELPNRKDLFIDEDNDIFIDDGITRWLIWIDEREFDIVADNWRGNEETWLSYASKVVHRGQLSNEDIFRVEKSSSVDRED